MTETVLLIDCLKIVTWLEDRKKLSKDWYSYEKAAEQKIKQLIRNPQTYLEQNQLFQYLKQNTDTFHFCDVEYFTSQLLNTKWAQNKSLVFGYSDQRVKQFVNLKKFMEKYHINIVNTAKFISQGLTFDLPNLNKSVELLDNQIAGLQRKINMNENAIYQLDKDENNQRIKLKLDTNKQISVDQQIPKLIAQTPKLFQSVYRLSQELSVLLNKYTEFCGNDENVALPTLEYFIKNGNQYQDVFEKGGIPEDSVQYTSFQTWVPTNQWGIQTEQGQKVQVITRFTLLQDRKIRLQLLHELNQLLFFYHGVKYQVSSKVSTFSSQKSINFSEGDLSEVIKNIQKILKDINEEIVTRIQIKNNPQIYSILIKKFHNYGQNINHMKTQNIQFVKQIQQLQKQREDMVIDLQKLRHKLVKSKNSCEKYLSDFIQRTIKIKGQINKLQ